MSQTQTPAAPAAADDARPADTMPVDAGTPTAEEQALIDQGLETDPTTGAPVDPAPPPAAEPAPAAAAAAAAAAPAPDPAPAAPAPAAAPDPLAALGARPEAPRDFDAELDALAQQYQDAELDFNEYQRKAREISNEQSKHVAAVALWDQQAAAATDAANKAFAEVESAWRTRNAAFLSNPLRREAMQKAIDYVDTQTGGKLAPADLFAQAEKIAFEGTGYTPPAPAPTADPLAGRRADTSKIPPTLGNAPNAGAFDQRGGDYAALDNMDVDSLENRIASMSPAQVEAYLADAPGASTTGA